MDTKKDKKIKKVKNMIKEGYYAVHYIEGYIDALFDCDFINDDEFKELNKLFEVKQK